MGIRSKLKFKDMSNVEFNLLTTHYKYYHHRIVENISIQSSTLKKCMSNNSSSPVMFDVHIFSLIYGFITSAGITNILNWPLSLKFHNSIPLLPFKMKQLYYAPISESGHFGRIAKFIFVPIICKSHVYLHVCRTVHNS